MKVPTKPVLAGMALASVLLASVNLANAEGSECSVDNWNDAPASEYCAGGTVTDSHAMDGCDVSASCSVTFAYGPGGQDSATLTPSVSLSVEHDEVDDIVICIASPQATTAAFSVVTNGGHGYTARARISPCNGGEATAAAAVDGQFSN